MKRRLNVFIPHCSELLTDNKSHGDGLVAHGFISHLAERGHTLYVVAEAVDLERPLPNNVHITQIGSKGTLNRILYMAKVRVLYRRLNREVGIDVIHQLNPVFTGMSLAVAGARAPLVLGPYVATWPHDPDATTEKFGILSGVVSLAKTKVAQLQQSQAAALLLTTPAAESRLPAAGALRSKIHNLPHGLDTELFSPIAYGGKIGEENQDILFLSNLVERKGLFDLLVAFHLVAPLYPAARLLIAGDGPELERAKGTARSFSSDDRIIFLGRQTREQSVELLRRCAIFCQPSHGEPFGMSALEAMSCARPLVVTNAGGLGHLVDDEGGVRVGVRCPEELAKALSDLLRDPAKRRAMGEHNRQRVVSSMSWSEVIDRLEDIYRSSSERSSETRLEQNEASLHAS